MENQNIPSKKIVLVGDSGVGKTSLLQRYVFEKFDPYNPPTMGAGFHSKKITLPSGNNEQIKLQIWDTAGQDKFKSMTKLYYRDADAAIVVYDQTYLDSFESAKKWVKDLREHGQENMLVALAGNKSDLDNDKRVSYAMGHGYSKEIEAMYFETSAKDDSMVNEMFIDIAEQLYQNILTEKSQQVSACLQYMQYKVGGGGSGGQGGPTGTGGGKGMRITQQNQLDGMDGSGKKGNGGGCKC